MLPLSFPILPFGSFELYFFSILSSSHLMCVLSVVCLILNVAARLSLHVGDDKLVI
jgi:hypothetical protein